MFFSSAFFFSFTAANRNSRTRRTECTQTPHRPSTHRTYHTVQGHCNTAELGPGNFALCSLRCIRMSQPAILPRVSGTSSTNDEARTISSSSSNAAVEQEEQEDQKKKRWSTYAPIDDAQPMWSAADDRTALCGLHATSQWAGCCAASVWMRHAPGASTISHSGPAYPRLHEHV